MCNVDIVLTKFSLEVMANKPEKRRGKSLGKESGWSNKMLQTVYGAVIRERPWDIRSVNKMYTTAKEKYMIELIKDGHKFSDETGVTSFMILMICQHDRAQVVASAPPPRDHLDQPPDADALQRNHAAERRNVDVIDDRADMVPPALSQRGYLVKPPDADLIQWNRAAKRQNVDVLGDRAYMIRARGEVVVAVPNLIRHPNPAPPPPEVDI